MLKITLIANMSSPIPCGSKLKEMKAIWNGQILAESTDTVLIEGMHYFPHSSIKSEFFEESETKKSDPWKGKANYFSIKVNGRINKDAAIYYPAPSPLAQGLKNRVAFLNGILIKE